MCLLLILLGILPQLPFDGKITPELREQLAVVGEYEKIEVIVHMREPYPYEKIEHLSYPEKTKLFRNITYTSQQPLIEYLNQYPEEVSDIRPFWVFNGLYLKATKDIIEEIAKRRDVLFVSYNEIVQIPPIQIGKEMPARTIEWNIQTVMADSCWAAGYTGDSIFIGHLDPGIDTAHPALTGNWSGKWRDCINHQPFPYDDHGHGTFTAGIICGGDGFGPFTEDIGVAPGV